MSSAAAIPTRPTKRQFDVLNAQTAVDSLYSINMPYWRAFFQDAHTTGKFILMFGDSQEKWYDRFAERINGEFALRYGNMWSTPVQPLVQTLGAFCMRSGFGQAHNNTILTSAQKPTSDWVGLKLSDVREATNADDNDQYGFLCQLVPNNRKVSNDHDIGLPDRRFFNMDGTIKAEIFCATFSGSGGVHWVTSEHDTATDSFFDTPIANGDLSLDLDSGTFDVVSEKTPALTFTATKYPQIQVYGDDAAKLSGVVGVRWVNETHTGGVTVMAIGQSSAYAYNFLQDHNESWPLLDAMNPDAAWLCLGANDVLARTKAQFKSDLLALIAAIRTNLGSNFPVILTPDGPQTGLDANDTSEWYNQLDALREIADGDRYVLVVESRKAQLRRGGFTLGYTDGYLTDNVHLTLQGNIDRARFAVGALEPLISSDRFDAESVGGVTPTSAGLDLLHADDAAAQKTLLDLDDAEFTSVTVTGCGEITRGDMNELLITGTGGNVEIDSPDSLILKTDGQSRLTIGGEGSWVFNDASAVRTGLGLGTIATQNANGVSISGGSITGITDLAVADGGTGASTLTGLVKGNGTSAFTAAVAATDYVAPGAVTTNGITMATARMLGRTTASTGAIEEITIGASLSLSAGSLNTIQDIRTTAAPTFAGATLGSGSTAGTILLVTNSDNTTCFRVLQANGAREMLFGSAGLYVSATAAFGMSWSGVAQGEFNTAVNTRCGVLIKMVSAQSANPLTIRDNSNNPVCDVTPTGKVDSYADVIRIRTSKTPASAGAAGNAGDICWDADYVYVCTATNTWKRSAIATWP